MDLLWWLIEWCLRNCPVKEEKAEQNEKDKDKDQ
jgi:hypothetical protein